MTRAHTMLLVLVLAAGPALAQDTARPSRPWDPKPESYRSPPGHRPTSGADGTAGAGAHEDRWRSVEVALSDESFWIGIQTPVRYDGHVALGYLATDDDDRAASAKLMRFGSPGGYSPLRLGVGLGAYGAWLEEPGDNQTVYALTLSAAASYAFPTGLPTFLSVDGSFAPDMTTFNDGDRLLDAVARFEVDVSSFASAFVGYRFFEAELEQAQGDDDHDIDNRFHVGVRLAF